MKQCAGHAGAAAVRSLGRVRRPLAGIAVLLLTVEVLLAAPAVTPAAQAQPAPAFTSTAASQWINTSPLSWSDLRGEVVLVEFWTFSCHNCYRSIPWLKSTERRFAGQRYRIIGVHTPEFDAERPRAAVEAKVREHGIRFPVMLDNDSRYWKAMNNRYWPAFYLVDRQGRLRAQFIGETHAGDRNAMAMEAAIAALLAEPGAAPP